MNPLNANYVDMIETALKLIPQRPEDAYFILDWLVTREPNNAEASFWLSYVAWGYVFDSYTLLRAKYLLEHCQPEEKSLLAAISYMLYTINMELKELNVLDIDESSLVNLLEASMKIEPNWISTRMSYAVFLIKNGNIPKALELVSQTQKDVLNSKKSMPCSFESRRSEREYIWESWVTGRDHNAFEGYLKSIAHFLNKYSPQSIDKLRTILFNDYKKCI